MVCDVCSSPEPVWSYPTRVRTWTEKLEGKNFEFHDDDGWSVCDPCARLVDARDPKRLAERAVRLLSEKVFAGMSREERRQRTPEYAKLLATQYREFFAAIVGERRGLTE